MSEFLRGYLAADEQFILERPRLNMYLENALGNQVVLVTAGEGYGKTQAIDSFLRKRDEKIIWVPLSERDNDPWHFWETVVKAVDIHDKHMGKTLGELGFPESPGQINRFYSVLSEIAPENKKQIIVVDDCQIVQEKSILGFFKLLMAFPLPRETFILISRTEIQLNTMPFLSKGLLFRITEDDLRFSEEEIANYFRLRNKNLSPEECREIYADTEGWILAISLIADELKNKKYSHSLLTDGSFRAMEEVLFASMPDWLQRFLVIASLFEQWPVEAMGKIAASLNEKLPPIEELVGSVKHLSSFIAYNSYLHGFRIHRLFLDYLREKQKELSREEIKTACLNKAQWCMGNNLRIEAAINYGMAADYEGLIRAVYSFPRLLPKSAAASFLEILDRVLTDNDRNEKDENFLFLRHVTRAGILINLGRYDESRSEIYKSIREFETMPPNPLSSLILSALYNTLGSLSLITYRMTRDTKAILENFQRADYYYMRHPFTVSGLAARANIGSYANPIGHPPRTGEFEEFIETAVQCIPHASNSIGGYLSGADSLCLAELAFFKGDLNNAERYAREAVFKAREKGQYEVESKSLFYLLRIHLCNGNVRAGMETWEQMEAQLDISGHLNRYVIYDITSGWFYAHIGETEQIAPWLKNEFEESDLNLSVANFETMVKAKSLFAEKKYTEALKFLKRKEIREGLGSFHLGLLEITVLEIALHSRRGDEEEALKTLETAYEMSAPNSLEMPFIELGEDMRILTETALNSQKCAVPRSWLETIRKKSSAYAKKLSTVIERRFSSPDQEEIPHFTSQELTILAGISKGSTREEIAYNVSLSINTVKSIIKTIYDKLGAFNRADAIRIAAGLGLLNPL